MSSLKFDFDPVTAVQIPLSERVLDRLADIMFASDEILDMLRTTERSFDEDSHGIEIAVRGVYNQVNSLMKTLTD